MDLNSRENKSGCMNNAGTGQGVSNIKRPLNSDGFLDFGRFTNIETYLQNRHRNLNDPDRSKNDYQNIKRDAVQMCNSKETFINEDSRFVDPNIRGERQDKQIFSNYLYMNPQNVHASDNNQFNSPRERMGQSTRYDLKRYDKTLADYKEEINSKFNPNISFPSLLPRKGAKLIKAYDIGK